jgi:hypothetical protein
MNESTSFSMGCIRIRPIAIPINIGTIEDHLTHPLPIASAVTKVMADKTQCGEGFCSQPQTWPAPMSI